MVGVAFLTLLERRVLGYVHIRKDPNKVGFVGILQTFSDAIKFLIHLPMRMEPTESSVTSAINFTWTPGTYPKDNKLQDCESRNTSLPRAVAKCVACH